MNIDLRGRAALITGGSQGLGRAIAARMAASGADVAILARRPDVLEEARVAIAAIGQGKVLAVPCDVSKAEDVARGFAAVMDGLGRVDILMNNAGASRSGAFPTITDEVWQADLDLKLFAAIRMTRLAWPGMVEQPGRRSVGCPFVRDMQRHPDRALAAMLIPLDEWAGSGGPTPT